MGACASDDDTRATGAPRRRAARRAPASRRGARAGASASSGCCATSIRRRSPRGLSGCACALRMPACLSARWSSAGASSNRVARGPSEAGVLRPRPPANRLEAVAGGDDAGRLRRRRGPAARHFLDVTRHVRLEIAATTSWSLRLQPPDHAMGEVLRSVLRLKLNGMVDGRDAELRGATRMRSRVSDVEPARPASSSSRRC